MLKGFKEFLSRGNIIDLSVAVVIGTAFTALVKSFTDSVINPLVSSIGFNQESKHGILNLHIPGTDQYVDFNTVLSAAINFLLVAAVVYFLIVLPYSKLRKQGEVEQADDAQVVLLEEIRDLLAQTNGAASSGRHGGAPAPGNVPLSPPPNYGPRSER
ncbi:large-conductance mechanosensitive channel protein MscL [Mycobacterium vicinigordonae]|uniref:Large-conductance mechanosensitive channel n=1 Tax=Mycobacterium vicinigordonae TaxID=1719132 RepID=A0A7D6EAV7_9MYCO|nr:large-conductance mechanosensitive channel protein MscL [Mycobacterium vicinigordonae]QLL10443.1 large-conductance mechanosensitive channel protein MscL [Mycobacterium vicinigordonae]